MPEPLDELESGPDRPFGVVPAGMRGSEQCQQTVAFDIDDITAEVVTDGRPCLGDVAPDQQYVALEFVPPGQLGRTDQVAEHHHHPRLPAAPLVDEEWPVESSDIVWSGNHEPHSNGDGAALRLAGVDARHVAPVGSPRCLGELPGIALQAERRLTGRQLLGTARRAAAGSCSARCPARGMPIVMGPRQGLAQPRLRGGELDGTVTGPAPSSPTAQALEGKQPRPVPVFKNACESPASWSISLSKHSVM